MTEITVPERHNTYLESSALTRLAEWASSAQAAHEVASSLVQTSFVPEAFRGKAHEATAAILAGAEVGLSPMAALRSFDIINGTAAPRAITLRAVAQAAGHELVVKESTPTKCVIGCLRRGSSNWQTVTWTLERATKLGLTSKPNWRNQPQSMLLARATSEAAKLVASDAILGLNGGYSYEEIEDSTPAPTTTVSRSTTTTKISRKAPEPVEPELKPEVAPVPADVPAPVTDMISPAQSKKLHASLNDVGLGDRDTGLAFLTDTIGREITTSKDLTKAEASTAIEALILLAEPQPGVDDEPPLGDEPDGWGPAT